MKKVIIATVSEGDSFTYKLLDDKDWSIEPNQFISEPFEKTDNRVVFSEKGMGGLYLFDEATLNKKLKELSTSATIWYLTEKAKKWDEFCKNQAKHLNAKTPKERSEAARKAVQARWAKRTED